MEGSRGIAARAPGAGRAPAATHPGDGPRPGSGGRDAVSEATGAVRERYFRGIGIVSRQACSARATRSGGSHCGQVSARLLQQGRHGGRDRVFLQLQRCLWCRPARSGCCATMALGSFDPAIEHLPRGRGEGEQGGGDRVSMQPPWPGRGHAVRGRSRSTGEVGRTTRGRGRSASRRGVHCFWWRGRLRRTPAACGALHLRWRCGAGGLSAAACSVSPVAWRCVYGWCSSWIRASSRCGCPVSMWLVRGVRVGGEGRGAVCLR